MGLDLETDVVSLIEFDDTGIVLEEQIHVADGIGG
jgi:hypothetical protein